MAKILSWCPNICKTLEKCVCKRSRHITTAGMSSTTFRRIKEGPESICKGLICTHTQTHCTGSSNSHHQVPPDQDSGTDHGLDLYFSFSQPPQPVFQTVPSFDSTTSIHAPPKATLASLPIWSSVRLLLVRPGVAVGSPPSPSTPGHTFRSCIPCRNMLERSRPVSVTFGLKDFPRLPNQRFSLPVFAKQCYGGPPDWDGPARSINVPHRESDLGILRKVRVLHRQPQPLVPAAKKSSVFKIYQTQKQKDSLMLTSNGC